MKNEWFSVRVAIVILAVIALVTGSTAATIVFAASPQTLPTCTDPTGQNLPCMMVISTLPPPSNAIQCQETTGQILPCSYATQILSNGQQIVVITVYVQPNFIFAGGPISVVKVLHEESAKSRGGGGGTSLYALSITIKVGTDPIIRGHIETITVTVSDKSNPSRKIEGAKVDGEVFYVSGFHKSVSCSNTDQNGKSQCSFIIGPNSDPGTFKITIDVSASGYKSASKSATFTVIPKTNITRTVNSTVPVNGTNTTSTNTSNMSSLLFKPPSNTSAAIQPTNTSIPTSGGGKGSGSTCAAGNCTSGPPPTVDCSKNPKDPSCTQTLAPPPTSPTTKICPDGSQPDSSGKCPTQSTLNPNNPLGLNNKKRLCPDGSVIPKRDKCPSTSTSSSPSSTPTSPSNPSGNPPPPSGGGSSGSSGSTGSSGSSGSSSSGSNSDSGPHHH